MMNGLIVKLMKKMKMQ